MPTSPFTDLSAFFPTSPLSPPKQWASPVREEEPTEQSTKSSARKDLLARIQKSPPRTRRRHHQLQVIPQRTSIRPTRERSQQILSHHPRKSSARLETFPVQVLTTSAIRRILPQIVHPAAGHSKGQSRTEYFIKMTKQKQDQQGLNPKLQLSFHSLITVSLGTRTNLPAKALRDEAF